MRLTARSTWQVLAAALLSFGLVACGGGDDDDAPIVVEGDPHTYVVDTVTIPLDAEQAEELGFDIDGDGTIDNQLGNILSALIQAGSGDLDLQKSIDDSVDAGEILLLANLQATSLGQAANAGFSIYLGENPSPEPCTDPNLPATCRQHLSGTGMFDVSATTPDDVTVGGNIVGGTFTGGPGNLSLQIAFGDTAINLTLVEARARVNQITEDDFGESIVGGAVPDDDIQNQVIPAVHTAISDIIAEDCIETPVTPPECGCPDGTTGLTLVGIFDEDENCEIPLQELRENSLIVTLLRPDVDTDGDEEPDALSIGVGATGIAGDFEPR